jgi:hypothetical protein
MFENLTSTPEAPDTGATTLAGAWALVRAYQTDRLTPAQTAQIAAAFEKCRTTTSSLLAHRSW